MSFLIAGKAKPEFDRKINMLIEIAAGLWVRLIGESSTNSQLLRTHT